MFKIFSFATTMIKKYILLSFLIVFFTANAQYNSVLSEGDWYKISTSENGIYQLNYSNLEELGINMNNLQIYGLSIFSNGNGMLPKLNSDFRFQDLTQISVQYFDNNNNGLFDPSDYILFYGQSPDQWIYDTINQIFSLEKHLFSDVVYYFLNYNSEQQDFKIIQQKSECINPSLNISTFPDFISHEYELENLIQSGNKWFGERFNNQSLNIDFNFPNLSQGVQSTLKIEVAARSLVPSNVNINLDNTNLSSFIISNISQNYATDYAIIKSEIKQFTTNSPNINLELEFISNDNGAIAWLDYIEVNTSRDLKMNGNSMIFRSPKNKSNEVANYQIQGAAGLQVWDVTKPTQVLKLLTDNNSNTLSFNDSINEFSEYIVFNSNSYLIPEMHNKVINQNLHAISSDIEYIIVSHPNFLPAANRLSNFHLSTSGLTSRVVTPSQIYNEFSSGMQDVTAIRDFVKHQYNKVNSKLKYLLLFGDGSYDPKDRINNNTNFIPTYQSENSTHPTITYVTDDYFGLLDDNEGLFTNDLVDIGIGRLPATNISEANILVDKIENYYSSLSYGPWRNNVTFIADDCDPSSGGISNPIFLKDADYLSSVVENNYPEINIKKIYLASYKQESTPGGPRSEDTQHAINNDIKKGTLLVNYTGHGSILGWAQERILEIEQIKSWDNINKLPLFMTATCKFSYFDDPENKSAGEYLLMNDKGGAIALLSTTRLVFSNANFNLNSNFTDIVFNKINGENPRLGDIYKQTKRLSGTGANNRNFTLLGDPALHLNYPEYKIQTTSINDTLKALSQVTVEGVIKNNGTIMDEFNGTIFPIVYDKEISRNTLTEDDCSESIEYLEQNNVLYKGAATVSNGNFAFSFIVPKDITYSYAPGKISYYAVSDDNQPIDATGSEENFIIGGTAEDINYDDDGPEIALYMNDRSFVDGGMTNQDPVLIADIYDLSGINTVGNGIGHDITAVIDGNFANPYILNDFYESNKDEYSRGTINFPLYDLDIGEHTLTLKLWDVFNNSSEATINFLVTDKANISVTDYLCFPNPFSSSTEFYFWHNKTPQKMNVSIEIYSITGNLVNTINQNYSMPAYRVGPIIWNGEDIYGYRMRAGMYIAKLIVNTEDGDAITKSTRVILLPN